MDFSVFIILEMLLEELSLGLKGITELWWVLSHNQAPTSSLLIALCSRWGRESEEKKKTTLGVEIKTKRRHGAKADTHHFPPEDWCPAGLWTVALLERFPQCFCWAWCFTAWNTPWSVWVSCVFCVPSQPPAHPQPTCWGDRLRSREDLEAAWALFGKSWAAGVISVLVTNPKHGTIWAVRKKINSVPARPNTRTWQHHSQYYTCKQVHGFHVCCCVLTPHCLVLYWNLDCASAKQGNQNFSVCLLAEVSGVAAILFSRPRIHFFLFPKFKCYYRSRQKGFRRNQIPDCCSVGGTNCLIGFAIFEKIFSSEQSLDCQRKPLMKCWMSASPPFASAHEAT